MQSNLFRPKSMGLLVAQFFGAMNDSVLKVVLMYMVIDGVWSGELGAGGQGIVSLCFTLPFILLSGYGGQIADRYSKRDVLVWVKIVEVPIALLALIGFMTINLWLTLLALVILTCQSSFFGPAKYGMIPELLDDSQLSKANGTINMTTNVAVILGTLIGGFVADRYCPIFPNPASIKDLGVESSAKIVEASELVNESVVESSRSVNAAFSWLPGVTLLVVALAGLSLVGFLPKLPRGDRNLRFDWNPVATYITSIREMAGSRILMVMLAWGYFYLNRPILRRFAKWPAAEF